MKEKNMGEIIQEKQLYLWYDIKLGNYGILEIDRHEQR